MNEKLSMEALGRMTAADFRESAKTPIIVILDNIRSGLNVGSIFRSADSFRIMHIYTCGYTPTPPHREVLKTALGATETVSWSHEESTLPLIEQLKASGVHCFAVEQTKASVALNTFVPENDKVLAVVLGNEVQGVDQGVIDACHGSIEIHQFGTKHSLNVAVATGIVLYDLHLKFSRTENFL